MDGTHDIETCARVSERVYSEVVHALHQNGILLEGCLLKPNMVTPGQAFTGTKATSVDIARFTIRTLQRTIPSSIPGITFLSGGQTEEEATMNLNVMNQIAQTMKNVPWNLTFSYGRALQHSCVTKWEGKEENVEAAQAVFLERARQNSLAQLGKLENTGTTGGQSLYQGDYVY